MKPKQWDLAGCGNGSVPLVKCGGVCGGAGGGSLGWWGGAEPGPARSLCWPGRG